MVRIITLSFALAATLLAQTSGASKPFHKWSEQQFADYLPKAQKEVPKLTDRVLHYARGHLGQPYEIYLLGEYPFEPYDTDPLYCLDRSDCVTFAEHIYSFALSDDWWQFLRTLQRLRYRDGKVGMVTRNHFTLADWNRNNAFLFEDMTTTLGGGALHKPLTQNVNRARYFAKFGIGQDVPNQPLEETYLPREEVHKVLDELRSGDFVNIIRGNDGGKWCGHVGLIARAPDGGVNLLHSAYPKVREEPLVDYLMNNRMCQGIKILRLRKDAQERMHAAIAEPGVTPISPSSFAEAIRVTDPSRSDWQHGFRLQSYRLTGSTQPTPELQAALVRIDGAVRKQLGMTGETACGVFDLRTLDLAMHNQEQMFYAASLAKLTLLLTYFAENPDAALALPEERFDQLARMIKRSENPVSTDLGRELQLDKVQETLAARRYQLYDKQQGGGLWCGQHYDFSDEKQPDPVGGFTHGANVLQTLRFLLMMEQGRLVSPQASKQMQAVMAAPQLKHMQHKFVKGLTGRDLEILRKSGTGPDGWHLDAARIVGPNRAYLLVGMSHDVQGEQYLRELARRVDDHLRKRTSSAAPN